MTEKAVEFNKTKRSNCLLLTFILHVSLQKKIYTTTTTTTTSENIEELKIVRIELRSRGEEKRKEAKLLREYIIFIEIAFFSISIKHIKPHE